MKARSQWKTQAACHIAQDITWMHAADKTQTACNNTKHNTSGQKSTQPSELETACTTACTQNMERECPNPDTTHETQDMSAGIQTPRSNTKQGTQTREHTARALSKPCAHMKTGHDGSVRALSQNSWMTPDRIYRTLTVYALINNTLC